MDDDEQIFRLVKIEAMHDAESRTQWSGDQSSARRGAYQREMAQRKRMNARSRPLSDDQVHAKIFHRGIENFFNCRLQPVDFVEKKNLFLFEGGQNRREVAFAFEQR